MRDWATTRVRHGTHSGWALHTELKERPCDPCYRAKQAYDHRRKSAGLAQLRARKKARAQAIATRRLRRKYPGVWRQLYAEAVAEILAEEQDGPARPQGQNRETNAAETEVTTTTTGTR